MIFIAVPAEEDSGLGTLAAIRRGWSGDATIVTEPTCGQGYPCVIVAHAGAMTCSIEVQGRAAHASRRLLGESALDHYLAVHTVLRENERQLNASEQHPLMQGLKLPYATSVGTIHGGSWTSSVMDRLEVEVRIGVALNETTIEAQDRFERTLKHGLATDSWLRTHPPTVRWHAAGFGSAQTRPDHPLVAALCEAGDNVFGIPPAIAAAPYGCDMSAWVRIGRVPTVVYGPGDIGLAHAPDEWVSMDTTERVARVLVQATDSLLAAAPETLRHL